MGESPATRPSLLLRIRDADDHLAWQQFVEIYAPLVYDYGRCRGLQDADAGDVAQEVLRKVAIKAKDFDYDADKGSFRGWLFTITRNQLLDLIARRRKDRASGETSVQEFLAAQPDQQSDEEVFQQHHEWRLFTWAAEKAKVDFREKTFAAFWQNAVENHPAKQVAAKLDISVGAVHIAKSRVLTRIRELLADLEGE